MKKLVLIWMLLLAFDVHAQDTLRLRVMTYNLRFGELSTIDRLAEHIKAFQPDFVALEEVDVRTNRSLAPHQNGKDMLSELAGRANMFGLYGKAIDYCGGYYGIGILSKYPYVSVAKLDLPNPQPEVEPRVLLEGVFEVGTDTVRFAATHLDVTDGETRLLQAQCITDYFAHSSHPVIIGGDFNAMPDEEVVRQVMNRHWFDATDSAPTYPSWNPEEKLDYIYALPKKGWRLVRTQAVLSQLSDHLPVVTDLEYVHE